ncbi:MAG: histidine--tRNA ligase [Bdellovibrionales bacterium]|nr:histidine--tRNA ligase [Bdellovibrionales bacterium]
MAQARIEPRILKGFRDYLPQTALPRQRMVGTLQQVFASFGFAPIDTPALEYAEILLGKGSQETDKQMYRFQDQGDRDIALRFDLTIPFARFAAMHIGNLGTPFRRYHIAPVWRAEKPQRGRYREFIQCDFDIIGATGPYPDAEIVAVIHTAMESLKLNYRIRVNSRAVLNALLNDLQAGDCSAAVLRAIDKLEKLGRDTVENELRDVAGLSPQQTSAVFAFLESTSTEGAASDVCGVLRSHFSSNPAAQEAVSSLEQTLELAIASGVEEQRLAVDVSIARGLDYYTGIVFETVCLDAPHLGSVCSGGRYDNLASLYTSQSLPGVGASVGLDRVLAVLEELNQLPQTSSPATVLVTVFDEDSMRACAKLAARLRQHNVAAEIYPQPKKLSAQLKYANRRGIPFAVLGSTESYERGEFGLKELESGTQHDGLGFDELLQHLRRC